MRGVAELLDHGGSTGRADAPQQTGITLDLSDNNVVRLVVHYELHGGLGERELLCFISVLKLIEASSLYLYVCFFSQCLLYLM